VNPVTTLIWGLAVTVVVVLSWLGGIVYLRRMRKAMRAEPIGELTDQLQETDKQAHSIEAWLARAEALPEGKKPESLAPQERDQNRLQELADRHFPHIEVPHPHLNLIGITGLEKRLVTWGCEHTGLPNPFDALERLTGDPDDLKRATKAWHEAHADVVTVVDQLCVATANLHENWTDPSIDREMQEKFFGILADYLTEIDGLAADLKTTEETLRGMQAEAALAEGTIVGLINLLIGSLGGFMVEAVMTAGTMTPAVAAQAQVELTWVLKQVARALGRLGSVYTNTRHVLQSVTGFKGLDHMHVRFQIAEAEKIATSIDATI
jgi:hypothetical protein